MKKAMPWVFYTCLVVQLTAMTVMNVAQWMVLLRSIQGVLLSLSILLEVFLVFNLLLAWDSYREKKTSENKWIAFAYLYSAVIIAGGFIAIAANGTYEWLMQDSIALLIFAGGSILVMFLQHRYGWDLHGTEVKTGLSIFAKAVPHLLLAWNIAVQGGNGISPFIIWICHGTSAMRLTQINIANFLSGWTKAGCGMLIAECASEATWIVVTIAWCLS